MRQNRYPDLAAILRNAIKRGDLPPGSRLPPHRLFAEQHGVALGTATRAYRLLEQEGLIVGEAGRGMFVRDPGISVALGVEQAPAIGLLDLVFNMPGSSKDSDLLRDGLKRLAASGDLEAMLRYQPHGGRPHERRVVAQFLQKSVGPLDPEQLLLTSGAQHGLALVALGLLQRGDRVAVDPLTYPGFKAAAALQDVQLVPVQGEDGVMRPDQLEQACRKGGIRAVYLMPSVHNPLGSVMDETRRKHIVALARRYDFLIIEDSAYAFLAPRPPPSFARLAPERTVYIGGISKNLATGLRLGYLVAPAPYGAALSRVIRATTWNVPALISALVVGWIEDGTITRLERARRRDGWQRQRLLRQKLGEAAVMAHPCASFAWLPLAPGLRAEAIVSVLATKGVALSSGAAFSTIDATPQGLRLAFGGTPQDELAAALDLVHQEITAAPT